MLITIIEVLAVALILAGIIYEEKLIAFEDKALDWLAEKIARVIIKYRCLKANDGRR